MKAVLLAAGRGTRLRPLTDTTPKPMLLVGGRPILAHTFDVLPDAVDEVVLVVGYLAEQIRQHFGGEWHGRRVRYVTQEQLTGTGGALASCRAALTADDGTVAPFLVLNGDDLYDAADLAALVTRGHGILACRTATPGRFGAFQTDAAGNLQRIIEATHVESGALINAGAYALDGRFFEYPLVAISDTEFGLPQTVAQMTDRHAVAIVEAGFWMPIGRPEELAAAEAALAARAKV